MLLALLLLTAAPAIDTVVVCPQAFRPELSPWIEHRTGQGHGIAIVSNLGDAAAIRARIAAIARDHAVRFVVLVGDSDPAARADDPRSLSIPAEIVPAKVNIHFGSEPTLATDNRYGDFNGDGLPDAAVGRLSCRTPQQLRTIVSKILQYERRPAAGAWRRKINFVAGAGDFGPLADAVLESVTGKFLTEGIPASYLTSMTYGSWRSPYCPDPERFREATCERLSEGCLFWVYIGHGDRRCLAPLAVPGGLHPVLDVADTRRMAETPAQGAPPIALFLACYTAAYDEAEDCLAEELLRTPGGPVAVIGGSRVTMPYAMGVLGTAMMDEMFRARRATLGEVLLAAKRRLVEPTEADRERRQWLDMLAAALSPKRELLAEERAEHVRLFNLLGDPLLRLRHPHELSLAAPSESQAGERITIEGTAPIAGRCVVELVYRRDRLAVKAPARPRFDAAAGAEFHATYERANDRTLAVQSLAVAQGVFRTELEIPAAATGACHVLVHLEGEHDFALGSADLFVRRASAGRP